jgi:hypothetical protein
MHAPSARRDSEDCEANPAASSQASTCRTLSSTSIGANRGEEDETNEDGYCMVSARPARKRQAEATDEEYENRDPGPSTQRPRN